MPDGVTHFEIGVAGGIVAVWATAAYTTDYATVRAVVIGSAIGLLITPDLDQEGRTFTEALLRRIPVVGYLFQVSWYGYALLFRHRGLSHHLLVGTLTRLVWAALLLIVWSWLIIGVTWWWSGQPQDWIELIARPLVREAHPAVLAAWWLQDALHILADQLT